MFVQFDVGCIGLSVQAVEQVEEKLCALTCICLHVFSSDRCMDAWFSPVVLQITGFALSLSIIVLILQSGWGGGGGVLRYYNFHCSLWALCVSVCCCGCCFSNENCDFENESHLPSKTV